MTPVLNDFMTLEERDGIIVITRSALPLDRADMGEHVAAFERTMPYGDRRRRVLLFDVRAVRGNNDPAFERALSSSFAELFMSWKHIVFLVGSAVGKLQAKRLGEEIANVAGGGPPVEVFDDEAEAMDAARKAHER